MKKTLSLEIPNIKILRELLRDSGIDISKWGKGNTKTIHHLWDEILNKESTLRQKNPSKLVRYVSVAVANVYYLSPDGTLYWLSEQKQVFNKGGERRRVNKYSVYEKMFRDEDPRSAIIRGIQEELGITSTLNAKEGKNEEKISLSTSYPSLLSRFLFYSFDIMLNEEQFNPEGYKEIHKDMTTYFVWEIKKNN